MVSAKCTILFSACVVRPERFSSTAVCTSSAAVEFIKHLTYGLYFGKNEPNVRGPDYFSNNPFYQKEILGWKRPDHNHPQPPVGSRS